MAAAKAIEDFKIVLDHFYDSVVLELTEKIAEENNLSVEEVREQVKDLKEKCFVGVESGGLSRTDLQAMAKRQGISPKQKTTVLAEALHTAATKPPKPTPTKRKAEPDEEMKDTLTKNIRDGTATESHFKNANRPTILALAKTFEINGRQATNVIIQKLLEKVVKQEQEQETDMEVVDEFEENAFDE